MLGKLGVLPPRENVVRQSTGIPDNSTATILMIQCDRQ